MSLALLRALAALVATMVVLVALLYSSYLGYTDLEPPNVEIEERELEVDNTGRRVAHGRSWLARDGRLWHLHLEGSPEEIGAAQGRLTARLFRDLDAHVQELLEQRYGVVVESWAAAMLMRWDYRAADRQLRPDHRTELAALAAAIPEARAGRIESYHLLFLYQCFQELAQRLDDAVVEGSMFAAHKPSSVADEEGNLIIGRTLRFDLGRDYEPERVVTFYYPDGKYPFVSVGWPGLMGVVTGINARGLFVALNPARTDDPLESGSPLSLVLRQVLEEADTLDQAVEILRAAQLRTAGIVLIGDGMQRKAVVMELAPRAPDDRRPTRGEDEPVVWATDHMVREAFERDAQNDRIKRYTSSGHRYARLEELLGRRSTVDQEAALATLRDRKGLQDGELGLGNLNALDNLATTHSVIVDATSMVLWVAEGPSTLGRYRAFDLRHLLGRQGARSAPLDDMPPDPLLYSEEYNDYKEALGAMEHARYLLSRGYAKRALSSARVALALAPDVGDLHRILGDIERELGDNEAAIEHYHRYLELVPGRLRDQQRVRGILAELGG